MKDKIKHPLYNTWTNMKRRCNNPKATSYSNYGGRGIVVGEEWTNSFEQFVNDMGPRPEGYTLDRINNDGNYCAENCKWSSRDEQSRNRSTNKLYEFRGESKMLKDWAIELDITLACLEARAYRGLTGEELFRTDRIPKPHKFSPEEKKKRALAASAAYRKKLTLNK